jgi:peptidoglycan/LPS O-acetylase OafA/YrhL
VGILRVYLALCVISAHVNPALPWARHDSQQAVEIFYIVSGFYMALVLSRRYGSVKQFYASRFVRIFSAYWIVLFALCFASVVARLFFDNWLYLGALATHPLDHNGMAGFFVALLSNLTVLGQDWVMFLQHDHGQAFGIAKDFRLNETPLYTYLILPQCWSIGVELSFYLLAPYLNRLKTFHLALSVVLALSLRVLAKNYLGLSNDPWSYRFFPFELTWFLAGMLGYRLYDRLYEGLGARFDPARLVEGKWRYAGAAALILLALYAHARGVGRLCLALGYDRGIWLSYLFWPVAVAGLFLTFRKQSYDRFIGALSYPIYLVHVAVIAALRPLFARLALPDEHLGRATAIVSITLAALLYVVCLKPIERRRHAATLKIG